MIIVCGVDNTGKTSLVNHLVEKFELEQIKRYHTLPPVDGPDWAGWVVKNLDNDDGFTIADRFYIEEFVYGPVLRGEICIPPNVVRSVNLAFARNNPFIIWCNTDIKTIRKTFGERTQLEGVYERIGKLQKKFAEVLDLFPFKESAGYIYNFKVDSSYKMIDDVVSVWLSHEKARRYHERK